MSSTGSLISRRFQLFASELRHAPLTRPKPQLVRHRRSRRAEAGFV